MEGVAAAQLCCGAFIGLGAAAPTCAAAGEALRFDDTKLRGARGAGPDARPSVRREGGGLGSERLRRRLLGCDHTIWWLRGIVAARALLWL